MTAVLLGFAAAAWGVVMAVAPVLQIRRMLLRRSSSDVSVGYYGILMPGFVLWISYGISRSDWALVVPNAVALIVVGATILVARVLRHGHAAMPQPAAGPQPAGGPHRAAGPQPPGARTAA